MTQTNNTLDIEQLTSQTAQLVCLLESFLQTLQSESKALKSNAPEDINQILPLKEKQSEEISLLTRQIEEHLTPLNLSLSDLNNPELSAQLPHNLNQNFQAIIELSNNCQNLNLANGMAIQILSNLNQESIKILSGNETPDVKLYGSSGEKTSHSGSSKQTLGKA